VHLAAIREQGVDRVAVNVRKDQVLNTSGQHANAVFHLVVGRAFDRPNKLVRELGLDPVPFLEPVFDNCLALRRAHQKPPVPARPRDQIQAGSLCVANLELKSDSFSYRTQLHSIPKLQHSP
jgi:hypothetical protein